MAADDASTDGWRMPDKRLLWDSLCGSIDCFVTVIDTDGRLRSLNQVADGFDPKGLLGRSVYEFMPAAEVERVRRLYDEVFSAGRSVALDMMTIDEEGTWVPYSVRAAPVFERGRVVAAVLTSHDQRAHLAAEASLHAERQVLKKLLETQERERRVVSYEIHDGLAQYLTSASMLLEACGHAIESGDRAEESLQHDLAEARRVVRLAIDESRRLINGLRPPMLDELGIVAAVESLVDEARTGGLDVDYLHPDSMPEPEPGVATALFRIVQESLSNIRKHAGAKSVRVVIEPRGAAELAVEISDDGVGFIIDRVPPGSFGLEGIRQRARLFGREAVIETGSGRGVRIRVVLPMRTEMR